MVACVRVNKVLGVVNREVYVADTVQVEVWRKLVGDYCCSRLDELLYQSSHQGFSCPVWYAECQTPSSTSLDHTENPRALTDPPAVVLAFVAKQGLVDLDNFSSTAQLQVAM